MARVVPSKVRESIALLRNNVAAEAAQIGQVVAYNRSVVQAINVRKMFQSKEKRTLEWWTLGDYPVSAPTPTRAIVAHPSNLLRGVAREVRWF